MYCFVLRAVGMDMWCSCQKGAVVDLGEFGYVRHFPQGLSFPLVQQKTLKQTI